MTQTPVAAYPQQKVSDVRSSRLPSALYLQRPVRPFMFYHTQIVAQVPTHHVIPGLIETFQFTLH